MVARALGAPGLRTGRREQRNNDLGRAEGLICRHQMLQGTWASRCGPPAYRNARSGSSKTSTIWMMLRSVPKGGYQSPVISARPPSKASHPPSTKANKTTMEPSQCTQFSLNLIPMKRCRHVYYFAGFGIHADRAFNVGTMHGRSGIHPADSRLL